MIGVDKAEAIRRFKEMLASLEDYAAGQWRLLATS
jgi:hypothetical protein